METTFFAASGGKRECIAVAMNRTEVYEKKGLRNRREILDVVL